MAARRLIPKLSLQASERPLVETAQLDPAKFVALELHFERVYAFMVRRGRDRVTADLAADAFHKADEATRHALTAA